MTKKIEIEKNKLMEEVDYKLAFIMLELKREFKLDATQLLEVLFKRLSFTFVTYMEGHAKNGVTEPDLIWAARNLFKHLNEDYKYVVEKLRI